MRFCFEHIVPASPERVFRFFQNPAGLELLHAGWSRVRLLHYENQVRVGAETWVEMTVAGFIPLVLGFRHTLFEPPVRFGEEAIHGPFSRFSHVHEFLPGNGNTMLRDLLELCLPRHYGGEAVMRNLVAPVIRRTFLHRAEALIRLADRGLVTNCGSVPVRNSNEI